MGFFICLYKLGLTVAGIWIWALLGMTGPMQALEDVNRSRLGKFGIYVYMAWSTLVILGTLFFIWTSGYMG